MKAVWNNCWNVMILTAKVKNHNPSNNNVNNNTSLQIKKQTFFSCIILIKIWLCATSMTLGDSTMTFKRSDNLFAKLCLIFYKVINMKYAFNFYSSLWLRDKFTANSFKDSYKFYWFLPKNRVQVSRFSPNRNSGRIVILFCGLLIYFSVSRLLRGCDSSQ